MAISIKDANPDNDTMLIFAVLIYGMTEAIKEGRLSKIHLFEPATCDDYIRKAFEDKTKETIDEVYYLCIEDQSDDRKSNFGELDLLFQSFRQFIESENMTKMNGYDIAYSGVLQLASSTNTFYYLTFCLQDNRCCGTA